MFRVLAFVEAIRNWENEELLDLKNGSVIEKGQGTINGVNFLIEKENLNHRLDVIVKHVFG